MLSSSKSGTWMKIFWMCAILLDCTRNENIRGRLAVRELVVKNSKSRWSGHWYQKLQIEKFKVCTLRFVFVRR